MSHPQPRTLIIYNPTAGRARRAWPQVKAALDAARVVYAVHETTAAGDATTRTRAALREGCEVVAALGGDGTLGETVTGFFDLNTLTRNGLPQSIKSSVVFAPLPAGTGNDFTRALTDGTPQPLKHWLENLTSYLRHQNRAHLRTIDTLYGTTDDGARPFVALNLVSLGLSVEVIRRVREQNRLWHGLPGGVRFVGAALAALSAWREQPVTVTCDDAAPRHFATNLLAFANSRYAGGGMMFAPAARLDDGYFDALLTGGLTRREILRELPRIRHGGHVANPKVTLQTVRRVCVETHGGAAWQVEADSNLLGSTPLELRVMPAALRVLGKG